MSWRSLYFLGPFFGFFVALIPHVLWLISLVIGKIFRFHVPYAPFGWTALGLVLLLWTIMAWGHFVGRFRLEINEVEYVSDDVPRDFDGYRLVHISDLHAGTFNSKPEKVDRIVKEVNDLRPDLICFTGDIATMSVSEILPFEEKLKQLHAEDGVMSILGNHDFFIYSPDYHTDAERDAAADTLTLYQTEMLGWKVLRNTSVILKRGGDSLAVAGVDNIHGDGQGFETIQKGDLKKAVEGLEGIFTILMTHDPSHWEAEVLPLSEAQITLSGHTHAGQIRIFGWSPANLMFKDADGRSDRDGRMLYVNSGLGCTVQMRLGCPAEITLITLKRK